MEPSQTVGAQSPFGRLLGLPVSMFTKESGTLFIPTIVFADVQNFIGTVHGGWLAAIIDEAFAQLATCLYGPGSGGTLLLNVCYVHPVRPKMKILVTATCTQETATGAIFSATIQGGGKTLVRSTTTWGFREKYLRVLESQQLPVGTKLVRNGDPYAIIKVYRRSDPACLVISTGFGRTAHCPYVVRNEKTGEEYSITSQEAEACKVS